MKKTVLSIAALLAGAIAYAQNLNPVVEVTNAYAREASGIEKPSQLRPFPDSVSRFGLEFDYGVRETPYKGAYEFNPYLVNMMPSREASGENKLYFSAGAGYTLHPEVDLVWNPVRRQNLRFDAYAAHRSYIGPYRNIVPGDEYVDWDGSYKGDGINSRTEVGAGLLYAYRSGTVTVSAGYRNLLATNFAASRPEASAPELVSHGRGEVKAHLRGGRKISYEASTRVASGGYGGMRETVSATRISLGMNLNGSVIGFGGGLATASYPEGSAYKWELIPHYLLVKGKLKANLGIKFSGVSTPGDTYGPGHVFPDVQLSMDLSEETVFQAAVTGGNILHTYDSLVESNPYLAGFDWKRDISVERFNAWAGIRGSRNGRFSYDIKAGYQHLDNAYGWSYYEDLLPTMVYVSPLRTLYVDALLAWKSESWDILAKVRYGHTPMPLLGTEVEKNVFAPASLLDAGHIFYNWNGRIRGGLTLEGRSRMKGRTPVPAYQDLGFQAEYAFSRKMSIWLKGGNLLGHTIQRIPFYSEGGIYITAGARIVL